MNFRLDQKLVPGFPGVQRVRASPPSFFCRIRPLGALGRLLAAGAAVDQAESEHGWTPLYIAADQGHEAVVGRLLAAGAAVDRADSNGDTPLSVANEKGHTAIAAMLRDPC